MGAPREDMDAWRDADIAAMLAEQMPFPVLIQNDATAACAAELAEYPENAEVGNEEGADAERDSACDLGDRIRDAGVAARDPTGGGGDE